MIEFRSVTKLFYKGGHPTAALKDVTLAMREGSILGIVGASGAGKSTLIRCVNGLEKPTSGEVIVNGRQMTSLSEHQLIVARRQIGMIFQHFNLLSSHTVFENIAFPLRLARMPGPSIKNRVLELLSLVHLQDKEAAYPASLSGGQKQRVAIARALATNPKVLLCDEATSSLDPASTKSILALLKDINRRLGITILLITHEMDVVKSICDEMAIFSQGSVVQQGRVGDVFANPGNGLARQFIESAWNVDLPEEYRSRLIQTPLEKCHAVLRIQVTGAQVDTSVLSETARLYNVDHHLLHARIDSAGSFTFGVLIVEVRGTPGNVASAVEHLKQNNQYTTVMGYV